MWNENAQTLKLIRGKCSQQDEKVDDTLIRQQTDLAKQTEQFSSTTGNKYQETLKGHCIFKLSIANSIAICREASSEETLSESWWPLLRSLLRAAGHSEQIVCCQILNLCPYRDQNKQQTGRVCVQLAHRSAKDYWRVEANTLPRL